MEADYSKQSLARFLDTADKQGFFNANTLAGMGSAVARLLEDMQTGDDVRKVDVEAATIRYHNKHPGDLSSSLRTYEGRLKRLIEEFVKYNDDPAGYKPHGSRPAAKSDTENLPRTRKVRNPVIVEQEATPTDMIPMDVQARTTPTAMAMQYPLRDDFVAQVLLPRGMTSEEAKRLCAFIRTLAADFAPEN